MGVLGALYGWPVEGRQRTRCQVAQPDVVNSLSVVRMVIWLGPVVVACARTCRIPALSSPSRAHVHVPDAGAADA